MAFDLARRAHALIFFFGGLGVRALLSALWFLGLQQVNALEITPDKLNIAVAGHGQVAKAKLFKKFLRTITRTSALAYVAGVHAGHVFFFSRRGTLASVSFVVHECRAHILPVCNAPHTSPGQHRVRGELYARVHELAPAGFCFCAPHHGARARLRPGPRRPANGFHF